MGKAIFGHLSPDAAVVAQLVSENRVLRRRVADLEDLVHRLHTENDALAEVASDALPVLDESMQPV